MTSQINDFPSRGNPSRLVCLDLAAQGRLLWQSEPPEAGWALEGAPVCDGSQVYIGVRRSDVQPQAYIDCLDAETGKRLWRRFICAAETPARRQIDETTHNLLTLDRETLYYNTNLGAIAALSAQDGHVRWIHLYRRASSGNLNAPAAHWYRDLNPCIFHRGLILAAPADSDSILALEAATGQLAWETPHPRDAVHLLGVGGGNLIATGDRVWWIDVETGKLVGVWPDGPSPRGYGRGTLVGGQVYWPTRREIHVFDSATADLKKVINLSDLHSDVTGGNLLFADGFLVIATGDELIAFSQFSRRRDQAPNEITERIDRRSLVLANDTFGY